ncbi:MAG: methyltransferase domain-containing protein [Glaciecola sp.]|nr:methyltransferase domain-containing protein [Glaciecola sp.]MDG2100415.1 methyltransferase domain-containing protein [Glaciecola sp.]
MSHSQQSATNTKTNTNESTFTATSDHGFDGISDKFARNIYGTTKGTLRHTLLCHHLQQLGILPEPHSKNTLRVLDAGCGLGQMSTEFAKVGYQVDAIDVSGDSIESARQQALQDNVEINYRVGQLQDVTGKYDIIINHAVLEWLSEPFVAIDLLIERLEPNGYLSLSFFNKDALTFGNLLYGNFDYVKKGLKVKKKVRLNPQQPLSVQPVLTYLQEKSDVKVIHEAGIRCIHDYMRNIEHQTMHYSALVEAEKKYSTQPPYKWLGKYFHIVIQKR